ncbi:MAG: transglycosylase domain-containing protein [Marinilabiliaceae bacterium]|nr:transglycosylase domain-containing protein [Marinilabiliaceae bacterium]
MALKEKQPKGTKNTKKTGNWKRKALIWSLRVVAAMTAFFFLLILMVYIGVFAKLPSTDKLKGIENYTASIVYSVDGKIMGGYYVQNRQTIPKQEIPQSVKDALIATEDSRFFEHKGLDFIGIGRVVVKTFLFGDKAQGGGSTISQQLAKNLYPRRDLGILSMPVNKIREGFIAGRLEKVFEKEDILAMYLNTVPFGEDIYGIEAAAQRFFSKKARFLNPAESATLVGMLAANTAYNPRLNPDKSTARRNIVLTRMETNRFLTSEEAEKWRNTPMKVNYTRIDQNSGVAPYFRERIRVKAVEILNDEYGDRYDIYTDGLKIYTTIDSRLQNYADQSSQQHMAALQKEFNDHWKNKEPWHATPNILKDAIRKSNRYTAAKKQGLSHDDIMKQMKRPVRMNILAHDGYKVMEMSPIDSIKHYLKILNTGFMAMDARTGYILAWIGGVDHRAFQYDHVTSQRQVGSTFKPFVYATALLNGAEPCDYYPNVQETYREYNNWSPANSDGKYEGYYTLKGALANSVNTIAAQLIVKTGPDEVADVAHAMGIDSDIPAYPSIALGTASLSLYEMVKAYAPFVNHGKKVEPIGLLKIEDKNGNILYKHPALKEQETVLDPDVARSMVEIMKGVINEGTARSLRGVYGLNSDLLGKTGTTQDNTDGWFIACTPTLVAGVWVGNDIPAIRFRSTALGQGAHTALPIFARFMRRVEADPRFNKYSQARFDSLPEYLAYRFDCEPFVLENPEKGFIERLFDKQDKPATPTVRKEQNENKPKSEQERQSLLDKMKDLFKKK